MKIGIVRYPGSNCDFDTLRYFENSFFIWHNESELPDIDLLVIPGGFAFGDRIYEKATGKYKISPGEKALESNVTEVIRKAADLGIPILGICNGFQILVKMGLLPGKLIKNNDGNFHSKIVKCKFDNYYTPEENKFDIPIANSYGNYKISEEEYSFLQYNKQIFLRYQEYDNGSFFNIAGVSNEERTIFGLMPHPERLPKNLNLKKTILNMVSYKYNINKDINRIMNSEHISYKSTRRYLNKLYTEGDHVIQGPGENAGIIDIGDGYALCLRIESHNHPVFIEPYDGAATGVGGILRDIFTMGARPIALLDFLRLGKGCWSEFIEEEIIRGISEYGNCVGVPIVGGDYIKNECYDNNPLLNVACIGLVKKENIIYGNALNPGSLLIYVGSKTGNEGIGGADMASKEFKLDINNLKNNVQKGDPFLEKLLIEACCELSTINIEGMQDMGAGGILCSTVEVVKRGRDKTGKNLGCEIYIDNIPLKSKMTVPNILISESQERMLIVSDKSNMGTIINIFNKWDLEFEIIGKVTEDGLYNIIKKDRSIYRKGFDTFSYPIETWFEKGRSEKVEIKKEKHDFNKWSVYDNTLGGRTIKGPLEKGSYAILDLYEVDKKLYIVWGYNFDECKEKMDKFEAENLAIVNCLNFGHPKDSIKDFSDTIDDLSEKCKKFNIPVIGGNVSLYNSTDNKSIPPTPVLMMVGTSKH